MTMKEVAGHLRTVIAEVLPHLQEIHEDEASLKPTPEKWSKKEILGHLLDSACNNHQKFVRTMAQPHLEFTGYAQNFWVSNQHYNLHNWHFLLDFWMAYNKHLAFVIENANPDVLSNTISIEGSQPFRLDFIMTDYVEHLKHHLKQILPEYDLNTRFQNIYNA